MFIGLLSISAIGSFGESLTSNCDRHIKCVYINNQPCHPRPTLDINSNETLFYPFTLSVNKTSVVEFVTLLMIHMLKSVFQIK